MVKISFSDEIGVAGIALAILWVVLDKAGKLKGGWLYWLLVVAGVMTLFIAVGNGWVTDAPGKWRIWRGVLMVCAVGLTYSGIAIWIAPESVKQITPNQKEGAQAAPEEQERQERHIPAPKRIPPYSRTETFIIDIPYYSEADGFPVPTSVLSNEGYPLAEAYSCIAGILMLYAPPDAKQITQIATLDTIDKRSEALLQSLRACIVGDIIIAERGSRKFGISRDKGSIAEYNPGIATPRAVDYPPDKLIAMLRELPFGKDERFLLRFRNRPLQIPEESEVKLGIGMMGGKYDSTNHWLFSIARPSVFGLTFGVAPINAAIGVLPGSFSEQLKAQQSKYTTYSLAVTMKIELQRDAINASEIEDYIDWADALWSFLRHTYDIKLPP